MQRLGLMRRVFMNIQDTARSVTLTVRVELRSITYRLVRLIYRPS
jgi:hypothetical protein